METKEPAATSADQVSSPKELMTKNPVFFRGRAFAVLALLFGLLLVAVLSFSFGFSAGIRKAYFSQRWDDSYGKRFMGQSGPMGPGGMAERDMMNGPMRSGHGTAGKIISLAEGVITIESPEGNEHVITVTDRTKIKKKGNPIEFPSLAVEDRIIVLGRPTADGSIAAEFIRALGKDDAEKIERAMEDAGIEPIEKQDKP